jgi:hypothetical protein
MNPSTISAELVEVDAVLLERVAAERARRRSAAATVFAEAYVVVRGSGP